jgi:hypothetical protein
VHGLDLAAHEDLGPARQLAWLSFTIFSTLRATLARSVPSTEP